MKNKTGKKVIVIGFDGATWDLLKPWAAKGWLPNIRKVMKEGVWGSLESTIPPVTGPAWTTFATGRNPGSHGCYNFLLPTDSLLSLEPINAQKIQGKTFYEILEAHGKRCILINLPCSYPPRIKKGILLPSFLTLTSQEVVPKNLVAQMPELKSYRAVPDFLALRLGKGDRLAKDVQEIETIRFKIAKKLFSKYDWDFFFILFSATDWIQHKKYGYLLSGEEKATSLYIQVFKDLDRYLGWFIKNLSPQTTLILMSDHGFKSTSRFFYINKWLKKNGFLKVRVARLRGRSSLPLTPRQILTAKTKGGLPHAVKLVSSFLINNSLLYLLSGQLARFLVGLIPVSEKIIPREALDVGLEIDPSQSFAYSISGGNVTGIYINDTCRFKDGLVKENAYEDLRGKIIHQLKNLKDPGGRKVFKTVLKKEKVLHGKALLMAPDILYVASDHILITTELSRRTLFEPTYKGQGWHHLKGIFAAFGPKIKKGTKISSARIIDLAPTILNIFDLPAKKMEGRVLKEIFKRRTDDLNLEKKINKSKTVIKKALGKFSIEKTAIAWTGGKDSTLLLFLTREVIKEEGLDLPRVLFVDGGNTFPEVLEFIKKYQKALGLKVDIVRNTDVLSQVKKLGDQVRVSRLNKRNRQELKRLGFERDFFPFHPESFVGAHLMKTVPMNIYLEKKEIEALLTGIRWDEQKARAKEKYFSPRRKPNHTRIHPLLHFSERDVWEAIFKLKIPYNRLYRQGYRSLGAKSSTDKTSALPAWRQDFKRTKERAGRAQDKEKIMERLRRLGYM